MRSGRRKRGGGAQKLVTLTDFFSGNTMTLLESPLPSSLVPRLRFSLMRRGGGKTEPGTDCLRMRQIVITN